ncbi:hypothetical protein HPULCUR_006980 [Helicostylum pulchrum]|uniref:Retrotransposon gag domain-containing protein n=1 Tax=Helicostylum pulchrum TaxID=562976 RepID=A0ABP9Y5E7_9FUNG
MEDVSSDVSVSLSPEVADGLMETAQENLINLKNQYSILYGHYLSYQKVNPDSDNTKNAFAICKDAEKKYVDAKDAFSIFKSIHEPVKMPDEKKSSLVPSSLPFLQLKTDITFFKLSEAHSLNMDDHWERLLPMSPNKEERSWFDEKLRNKLLSWSEARNKILDHFDTPYRKFLLMVKVWTLKQQASESTRVFASKFQNLRRQAGLHDGLQLVLCFWCALREAVRRVASVAVSSQYGSKLPVKIDAMIDLVIASTNDTDLFSSSIGSSSYNGDKGNDERSSRKRSSHSFSSAGKDHQRSSKAYTSSSSSSSAVQKKCTYCDEPWFHGHRCEAFVKAKKPKVSRMARRSNTPDTTDEDSTMEDETIKMIKKKTIYKKLYMISLNDDDDNEHRLAQLALESDNDVYTKRIGTCTLTVSCNSKTLKKEFEVMNLTDDNNEFSISIGTDYMSSLGMGIYGLPTSYDDHDSTQDVIEADRRYNNKSELLETIDAENSAREKCPACEPNEYNAAMEFINKYIKLNQSIPKGVFCTVPESVVCLDTPTDVTAYKKPYPIALKMHNTKASPSDHIASFIAAANRYRYNYRWR